MNFTRKFAQSPLVLVIIIGEKQVTGIRLLYPKVLQRELKEFQKKQTKNIAMHCGRNRRMSQKILAFSNFLEKFLLK